MPNNAEEFLPANDFDKLADLVADRIADKLNAEALADLIAAKFCVERDRLLTIDDLAKRLNLSPRGVRGLIAKGDLPRGILIGKSRRWDWDNVKKFPEARKNRKRRRHKAAVSDELTNSGVNCSPEEKK